MLVRDHGDRSIHDGQYYVFAHVFFVSSVFGVHRHGAVSEHRLGTRRRNLQIFGVRSFQKVAYVPQVPRLVLVHDLLVRERGLAVRAPVYYPVSPVYEALVVEVHENLPHGLRAAVVHREREAGPVAGAPELFELPYYSAPVFLLPLPRALEELLAPELLFRVALFFQHVHDLHLGRDGCMVRAGEPEDAVALHALEAHYRVLYRLVQGVPHVELPGDVGRGHHYRERDLVVVACRLEVSLALPLGVQPVFEIFGGISFVHVCIYP